jgi:cell division septation protein DedD
MINLLCDRSLMLGCEKQTSRISEEQVVAAAAQLGIDVPRNKIRGERTATAAVPRSKGTIAAGAALVAVAAAAVAAGWFLGNPLDLFRRGAPPAVRQAAARQLPVVAAALPVPANPLIAPAAPPPMPGSFSIIVGTYDNARQVQLVEARLRSLKMEPYAIDILMAPEDLQRRVLLGRFASRDEADATLQKIAAAFPTARVIPGNIERVRVLIP